MLVRHAQLSPRPFAQHSYLNFDYPDGRLAIRYRGLDLPYATFDKLRQVSQATIVENKHLGAVLSHIRERQIERAEARSRSAPRRQGQIGHMFKVG